MKSTQVPAEGNGSIHGGDDNSQHNTNEESFLPGTVLEPKILDVVYDRQTGTWRDKDGEGFDCSYVEYAFIVKRKFSEHEPTVSTTIQLNSPRLIFYGSSVIGSRPGLSWTAKPCVVDLELFLVFCTALGARLSRLRAKRAKTKDEKLDILHLTLFVEFLEAEYAPILREVLSLTENNEITYELLWAILIPDIILYTSCPITQEHRAVKLLAARREYDCDEPHWALSCEYVDVARNSRDAPFGFASIFLMIHEFKGSTPISSLPSYPMKWCPLKRLEKDLLDRGRVWSKLTNVHHRQYNGIAFYFNERGCPVKRVVSNFCTSNINFAIAYMTLDQWPHHYR
jgi:hypothetical protein